MITHTTLTNTLALLLVAAAVASAQDERETRELLRYQARLIEGSRDALAARTFAERNRIQAEAVTAESAGLAARAMSLTTPAARANLNRVFHSAALQSGEAFERAFQGDEAAKKAAPFAAGNVAYAHLPAVLAATRGELLPTRADAKRAAEIVDRARIEDVARIVAKDLGMQPPTSNRGQLIREIRSVVPTTDWFYGEIENIPERRAGDRPLTEAEQGVLRAGIRMANATWKAGQVHRAILDDKPGRVKTTGNYNPFDLMMRTVFRTATAEELEKLTADFKQGNPDKRVSPLLQSSLETVAKQRALTRTTFEVYKDLHELRRGQSNVATDTERRYAQKVRTRLGQLYVDELRTKTIPQLIAEAAKQGIDLRWSPKRLSRLSIMSALSGLDRQAVKQRVKLKLRPHVVANQLTFTDKKGRTRVLPFAGPAGQRLSEADRARTEAKVEGATSRLEGLIPGGGSGRRGARR